MEIKRTMRYLKGTKDYGLWYKKGGTLDLKAFTNVDWAGSVDDRKSTSGGALFLIKRLVSWTRKKHNYISEAIAEEKYHNTYRSMTGKLQYVVDTRPGISLAVGMVARLSKNLLKNHVVAIKRIMTYLKGTKDYGLWYKLGGNSDLKVFTNVD